MQMSQETIRSRRFFGKLCVAAVSVSHLAAVPGAPSEAAVSHWSKCYEAVAWSHRWDPPRHDNNAMKVMGGQIGTYQRRVINPTAKQETLDACLREAAEKKRLVFWYVPWVLGSPSFFPHWVDDGMMAGPLSDPDVAGVLNSRFVSLKMPANAPLQKQYGLTPLDFLDPGILILSSEGKVLHKMNRMTTFSADHLLFVLQSLLEAHGDQAPMPDRFRASHERFMAGDGPVEAGLDLAREALAAGETGLAASILDRVKHRITQQRHISYLHGPYAYLAGIVARRSRDGEKALASLQKAQSCQTTCPDQALLGDILVEAGIVRMKSGDLAGAEATFRKVTADHAASPRAPEAAYYLGVVLCLTQRDNEAFAVWKRLGEAHPDSIWSAKGAANSARGRPKVLIEGGVFQGYESVLWSSPAAYQLAEDSGWKRNPADARDVARRAVAFLLSLQRADGSWAGTRVPEMLPTSAIGGNLSIAALCCAALWEHRAVDPERVDAALRRAEPFLLDDLKVKRVTGQMNFEAIHWGYVDAFRLLYFAKRLPCLADPEREAVKGHMRTWVDHLVRHQDPKKGFVVSGWYGAASWMTATVTYCLKAARDAGIDVPEKVFVDAADALSEVRDPQSGLICGYGPPSDAASRQPLCEWVLSFPKGKDLSGIVKALNLYLGDFSDRIEKIRKTNWHIGKVGGAGGHYFFHNFLGAALAAAAVPGETGAKLQARMLADLCALPEIDGSFLDTTHLNGKAFGTAAALLSLKALTPAN